MKIFCDAFKKNYKLSESFSEKGNPILESTYLVFDKENNTGFAYFGSKEGMGRFKFYIESKQDEDIKNFFINTNKLNSILLQYDEVELNSSHTFSNGKDKYKVAVIEEDDQYNTKIFNIDYQDSFTFNKEDLDNFSKALSFVSKDDANPQYQGLFIQQGYLVGMCSKTPLYESEFSNKELELAIPYNISKVIILVGGIGGSCTIKYDTLQKSKKIVSADEELELVIPNNSSLEFPPTRTQNFVDSYTYSSLLKVDTQIFQKTINSLSPYFNDVQNQKIKISIKDDLEFSVEDKDTSIQRHSDYLEITDDLKEKEYFISGSKLLQVLSVLKDKELYISLPDPEEGGPIIKFYNSSVSMCLATRFKE